MRLEAIRNIVEIDNVKENLLGLLDRVDEIFNGIDINDNSKKDYISRIKLFKKYIKETTKIDYNIFLDYKRYLVTRNDLAVATKNKYLISAKIFFKELNRRGILKIDLTQNVKIFLQSKKHKRQGLNKEEVEKIVEYYRQDKNKKEIREWVIFCLLTFQGLRQIEVRRLEIKHIDLINGTLAVCGKGQNDTELVYMHSITLEALKLYIKVWRIGTGILFRNESRYNKGTNISNVGLWKIIKSIFAKIGLDKEPHGLRHYFATKMIKELDNLLDVQKYTRHKNLEMLLVYNDDISLRDTLPTYYKAFDFGEISNNYIQG